VNPLCCVDDGYHHRLHAGAMAIMAPLPHTAGKLMGVFMHSFSRSGNLNFLKHFNGSLPALASGTIFMQLKHLGNLIANGIYRVKRCHEFLYMQEMAVVVHSVFVQGNSFELRYTGTRLADI